MLLAGVGLRAVVSGVLVMLVTRLVSGGCSKVCVSGGCSDCSQGCLWWL